jgi:hypothetical protein
MAARPAPLAGHRAALVAAGAVALVVLADVGAVWVATRRCGGPKTPGSRLDRFCGGTGTLFHVWPVGLSLAVVAAMVGAVYTARSRSLLPLGVAAAPVVAALVVAWAPAVVAGSP